MEFLKETSITEQERKTAFDYFMNHPACRHLYKKDQNNESEE